MFGIGGPELIVIAVLALILVGPEQLPKVVKTVGTGLRDLRRAANLAQAELRETMDELVREVEADPPAAKGAAAAAAAAEEARRKVAEAVAQASVQAQVAARRSDGPPPAPSGAGSTETGVSAPAAAESVDGPESQGAAAAVSGTAEATPVRSFSDAAAASQDRARRRREIGDLLAAEAAKLQQQRALSGEAEILAPWTSEAPPTLLPARSAAVEAAPSPTASTEGIPSAERGALPGSGALPVGVSGTVPRRAAVARHGSPAAALAQAAAAQPAAPANLAPADRHADDVAAPSAPSAPEELV